MFRTTEACCPPLLHPAGIRAPHYRLPGDRSLDWGSLVATLRAVGYTGAISIENEDAVHPGAPGCERALRYLRRFMPRAG